MRRESDILAELAVRCLIEEAELTPKPGLVDLRGSGSHRDMTLGLLRASALALRPGFAAIAEASRGRAPDAGLRAEIGALGRESESRMMEATGGVNTHRGAIWTLGLLVAAASSLGGRPDARAVAGRAGEIARIGDPALAGRMPPSNGRAVYRRYAIAGAREEAMLGFPHIVRCALPVLEGAEALTGAVLLNALLAAMSGLPDTCIVHRGGPQALRRVQEAARGVLALGGMGTGAGQEAYARLEAMMLAGRLSPGGAADLLAGALFLRRLREAS